MPDADDPSVSRLRATLLARGVPGTFLWFLLLAGAIIALTLIANRCDDDDGATSAGETDAEMADEGEPEAEPAPTPEPEAEPTPQPEPTPTPEPTPEPEPTPTPDEPGDAEPADPVSVEAAVDGAAAVLTGTVPDEETADALLAAAQSVLGAGNVTGEMVIDPDAGTAPGSVALISLSGSIEERTGEALIDALGGVLPGADVSTDDLEVVASADVVGQLNALFAATPVQFTSGSAEILPESVPVLDEVAAALADAPALELRIEGHTDDTGGAEINQTLSEDRAQAVLDYLVDAGIAAQRLTAVGFGEERPIADNDTPEGQQANRRIEFVLSDGS